MLANFYSYLNMFSEILHTIYTLLIEHVQGTYHKQLINMIHTLLTEHGQGTFYKQLINMIHMLVEFKMHISLINQDRFLTDSKWFF